MESNIKGLVAAGHEMASELKAECGAVDMRSVAKLISDLATQLEVQLVRANALAEDHQRATESIKQADSAVKLAHEKFSALAAENAGLKSVIEYCINPDNQPEYHDQGMGCGVEDHGYQRDGYSACYYGWESAMERVYSEVIPDAIPETPATDAFLAEVRAQGVEMAMEHMQSSGSLTFGDCYISLNEFAAELRKGGNQ
ncbi:hNH endonuclease [Escherichia coli]|nr:hNH endonuclease [Escherichia coli]EKL7121063.1 hNH endonuclease [Escherichia coli]EKM2741903.1 hNH endonuclease [Escherichia coli]EKM3171471.1 hNH endonuclease [Escherichia coli]